MRLGNSHPAANIIKRHTRPNPSQNVKGGILDKEGPIAISNVLLMCPACNKHARVGRSKGAGRQLGARVPAFSATLKSSSKRMEEPAIRR